LRPIMTVLYSPKCSCWVVGGVVGVGCIFHIMSVIVFPISLKKTLFFPR
jgi:uncharacterized membrane protein HdeD (DUF308 family)